MTKEKWESKFGGGRTIAYRENHKEKCVFKKWVGNKDSFIDTKGKGHSALLRGDDEYYNDWFVVEDEPATIQEKSIEDFPLVEVSSDGIHWSENRYVYSDRGGEHMTLSGFWYKHMRPIQKVDIEELKVRARLV